MIPLRHMRGHGPAVPDCTSPSACPSPWPDPGELLPTPPLTTDNVRGAVAMRTAIPRAFEARSPPAAHPAGRRPQPDLAGARKWLTRGRCAAPSSAPDAWAWCRPPVAGLSRHGTGRFADPQPGRRAAWAARACARPCSPPSPPDGRGRARSGVHLHADPHAPSRSRAECLGGPSISSGEAGRNVGRGRRTPSSPWHARGA